MAIKKKRIKAHAIDGLISFISDEQTRKKIEFIKSKEGLSISMICRFALAFLWQSYEESGGRLPMDKLPLGVSIEDFRKTSGRAAFYNKKREELIKEVSKE